MNFTALLLLIEKEIRGINPSCIRNATSKIFSVQSSELKY